MEYRCPSSIATLKTGVQKVPANQPINPRIGRRYQANFLREGLASLSVVLRYQGNPQLVDVILVKAFVVIRPGADRGQRVSADLGCKRCRKDIILIGYPVRRAAADDAVVGVVVGAGKIGRASCRERVCKYV